MQNARQVYIFNGFSLYESTSPCFNQQTDRWHPFFAFWLESCLLKRNAIEEGKNHPQRSLRDKKTLNLNRNFTTPFACLSKILQRVFSLLTLLIPSKKLWRGSFSWIHNLEKLFSAFCCKFTWKVTTFKKFKCKVKWSYIDYLYMWKFYSHLF